MDRTARLRLALLVLCWLPYGFLLLFLVHPTLDALALYGLVSACTSLALTLIGLYLFLFRNVRDGWFCAALILVALPALYLLFAIAVEIVSDRPFHI